MMRHGILPAVAILLTALPLRAQLPVHDRHDPSPYVDLLGREIKALSAEEIAGLESGEGLGFALSAELNGVPGPKHVLDLRDALDISPEQVARLEEIQERMRTAAVELGRTLIDAEAHLDRAFASGHATDGNIRELTAEIGRIRGALRATHLVAHLETEAVLTEDQVAAYARLRGYNAASGRGGSDGPRVGA